MNSAASILIIDDEEQLRKLMSRVIALEGFVVKESADLKSAGKLLQKEHFDIILCDVKLPDGNGVDFTKQVKQEFPHSEIILLTAYGNIPDGVQAMKNGAFDYITKGNDNDKIIPLIYRASEKIQLLQKISRLEKQVGKKYSFDSIIGQSKPITAAIELAKKVAVTDSTVLLTGETGTGKEVFAQAIHNAGARSKQNFIAVNCSAFSKELLENELFGHKAGSFTGAVKETRGIFEEADSGTVFLDEIGEMAPDLQAKLLRVIEAGEFLKLGDSKSTRVNVRIIAATNRDLQEEITAGNFREDLYYRISAFTIKLPPLRERTADIKELASFFTVRFSLQLDKKQLTLSPQYIEALKSHPWKGNIRELKNIIERSIILTEGSELTVASLPPDFQDRGIENGKNHFSFDLASAEKAHIKKVLDYTNGNKTETARLLNIAVTTLYRKLEEYKLNQK